MYTVEVKFGPRDVEVTSAGNTGGLRSRNNGVLSPASRQIEKVLNSLHERSGGSGRGCTRAFGWQEGSLAERERERIRGVEVQRR